MWNVLTKEWENMEIWQAQDDMILEAPTQVILGQLMQKVLPNNQKESVKLNISIWSEGTELNLSWTEIKLNQPRLSKNMKM